MKVFISALLAFLIFFGSLMPQMDMEELSKIPALISHYQKHKKLDKNFSFISFLAEHYQQRDNEHSNPEHCKLPFFHHDAPNLVFVLNNTFELSFFLLPIKCTPQFKFVFNYIFSPAISFFQPPQMVVSA